MVNTVLATITAKAFKEFSDAIEKVTQSTKGQPLLLITIQCNAMHNPHLNLHFLYQ